MKDLKEKVAVLENRLNTQKELIKELQDTDEKLQENLGMIDVYKEIIKNSEESRESTKMTYKFITIIITILSVLIIILGITITINQKEFTRYREDSIPKGEIIELLKGMQ